eukprot:scaffold10291_cov146-Isochrysis_galbana.AAC.4
MWTLCGKEARTVPEGTSPQGLPTQREYLTPPKGVWEGPRALIHLPRNTRCRKVPFPAPLCLPCLVAVCSGSVKCACFRAGELDPLSRQGRGVIMWGRKQPTPHVKAMTDPPTDDTEDREPDDAPDPTDSDTHTHLSRPVRHRTLRHPRTVVDRPGDATG